MSSKKVRFKPVPSRYDRRFWVAGSLLMALAVADLVLGIGSFSTYPEIQYSPDAASLSMAAAFALGGFVTWRRGGRVRGGRDDPSMEIENLTYRYAGAGEATLNDVR
jgi:hypothetical protein